MRTVGWCAVEMYELVGIIVHIVFNWTGSTMRNERKRLGEIESKWGLVIPVLLCLPIQADQPMFLLGRRASTRLKTKAEHSVWKEHENVRLGC